MRIALVAHVEDQPVPPRVKHPVQGHGELHRPQIGGQVAAGAGQVPDQLLPQLAAQPLRLLVAQPRQSGASLLLIHHLLQTNPPYLRRAGGARHQIMGPA